MKSAAFYTVVFIIALMAQTTAQSISNNFIASNDGTINSENIVKTKSVLYADQVMLAEELLLAKSYAEALQKYEYAFSRDEAKATDLYNAACAAAQLHYPAKALSFMKRSIDAGFFDKEYMKNDADFAAIHPTKEWQLMLHAFEGTNKNEYATVRQ
jgi:hypothetical protein